MIISLPHRFVFVATPKCASTAIETMLRLHATLFMGGDIKHATFRDYQRYLEPLLRAKGVDTAAFEIFAVVREPVSWLHSWWRYRSRADLQNPNHPMHANYTGPISFNDFVRAYISRDRPPFARIATQDHWLRDASGSVERLTLFRYEAVGAFVAQLQERMGRRLSLPTLNVSRPLTAEIPEATIRALRMANPADFRIYDRLAGQADARAAAPGCAPRREVARAPSPSGG